MGRRGQGAVPTVTSAIPKADIRKKINNILESYNRQGYSDRNFVLAVRRYLFEQQLSVRDLVKMTEKIAGISYFSMFNYVAGRFCPPIHVIYLLEYILNLPVGYLYTLVLRDTLNGELLDKRFKISKKRKECKTNDGKQN